MSFLQPLLLFALPLAALPIIIHLINQRRFQNIDWGAMRFLLEANRMSRGFARIRQWLILLFRVLAVAALIFTVARPLARGRLGLMAGGSADTTIVLLDRSASMTQRGPGNVASKIETGVEQLAELLDSVGSSRWVLIDSVSLEPYELETPRHLVDAAGVAGTSASSDLPSLLQAAHDYVRANRTGQTEIWICSDLRSNDWNPGSGQWSTLRDAFRELPQGVRFHLLAYPESGEENTAVRVTDVRRQETSEGAQLLLSLTLKREGGPDQLDVPVQIEIDGARTQLNVEMEDRETTLRNHPVPIEASLTSGWGRVSIPADVNPADNEFYFLFAEQSQQRTVIVAEDERPLRPLQLAAAISPDAQAPNFATFVLPDAIETIAWEEASLLVWHAPLPQDSAAAIVRSFVERGGRAIFLPPAQPSGEEFYGVRWTDWKEPEEPVAVDGWRGDYDLFQRTQSGNALPVGELHIRRYCVPAGEFTPLATLFNSDPLLVRASSDHGGVYFLGTTTAVGDSSLAANGVVLYAAVQRALIAGAESLSKALQVDAGAAAQSEIAWRQIAGPTEALSTEYPYHAGAYEVGERTVAVNRSVAEDRATVLEDERVAGLFQGLDFDRIDDRAGNVNSLSREVWRVFLLCMLAALVVEASLCLPKRPKPAVGGFA